jgi:hypothetical protein
MAKCEEGYLCSVCGGDVEEITDSDLYLRFVIGLLDPETLHTTRERHIRCNPVLAQFIVGLGDAELGRVFKGLLDALRLAGELGLLLRIESLVARPSQTGRSGSLFAPREERIRSALARFMAEEGARASTRRRLFTDDAAQGVGLLAIAETMFDVVLMNPPFGEATSDAQRYIAEQYPEGANDIYAAFVLRFSQMLAEHGRLGAITSRSFFVGRDLRALRRQILGEHNAPLELVLDLGLGVLDAMVETAAYVLGTSGDSKVRFLDLRATSKATGSISDAMAQTIWREVAPERFRRLAHCQFLYDISDEEAESLSSGTQIESKFGRVTKGLSTGDDARFVRLRWEVVPTQSSETGWELFSKGGVYGWFGSDVHLVIKRHSNGAELAAHAERTHGNVALSRQSSTYYGRSAVTWSRRSQKGFSARRLRPGVCFSDKSPVIIPAQKPEVWIPALLAVLTTDSYLDLIYAQSKFGSYETGSIKTLPVPGESMSVGVLPIMNRLFAAIDEIDARDETCQLFISPPSMEWDVASRLRSALSDLQLFLESQAQILSRIVAEQTIEIASSRVHELSSPICWVSYAIGIALGRWDRSVSDSIQLPGPLEELPHLSQAEFGGRQPLSVGAEWLSDDEGAGTDVVAAVRHQLLLSGVNLGPLEVQLRDTMRNALFSSHLSQYSKSARRAPVYWQLASASARYSVWAYYHRLNRVSLFRLQNDYAAPKLRHEEQKLAALRGEFGASPSAAQRKELVAQETFVEELRAFLDEVKRVAPLWAPNFDDGVVINFAPLWRLVPHHKPWQQELRATWGALCEGEYDWAPLAMHLWPERVVPKCGIDRSLAIAHGLEDMFWLEGSDGKWTARKKPTRLIDELVRERTSLAVRAALKSLLEAPLAAGKGRRNARRRAAAIADEGAR